MTTKTMNIVFILLSLFLWNCGSTPEKPKTDNNKIEKVAKDGVKTDTEPIEDKPKPIIVGAAQLDQYLPKIQGKTIAIVVNQTSMVANKHIVDILVEKEIDIKHIFAPEHGFRGKADAGEKVKSGVDTKTGLKVISLYGKNKKPSPAQLEGVDLVIFDIQDVGVRFYTYISTMSYMMEACAENNTSILVLDRPNPNGHYVDGPVLESKYSSFVGLHKVPVVHGMTVAEYAQMVNEEGWLKGGVKCNLDYVLCENYTHHTPYTLPVKPSPNLPNNRSIYLYPWLCFFEGTTVSVGRGTAKQFQVIGHPDFKKGNYNFTPTAREGAKYPKHENKNCNGYDLTNKKEADLYTVDKLDLSYFIKYYNNFENKDKFFKKNNFFEKLAGTDNLRKQIIAGKTAAEIRASWKDDLDTYNEMRLQYLLYDD